MRPAATCELWIDGARVADTGAELAGGQATALTDLQLTWGRDGQNEQPGPASCAFKIADPASGDNALDYVHVGSAVAVWAEGHIPTAGGGGWGDTTYDNGGWTGMPDGPAPDELFNGAGVGGVPGHSIWGWIESEQFKLTPGDTVNPALAAIVFPPREIVPEGTLPNYWDDIPQGRPGETWRVVMSVKAPTGIKTEFSLRGFTNPYNSSVQSISLSPAGPKQTGTGQYQTATWDVTINNVTGGHAWLAVTLHFVMSEWESRRWRGQGALAWQTAPSSWDDYATYGTAVYVDNIALYPPAETTRRVLAFSGEVSDLTMTPDGGGSVTVSANAMDLGAKLGQTVVGDNPWPVQTVAVRADRIAELAGVTSAPRVRIDAPLDALKVSYRDVDAQPAYALLQDLAQSAGGVLWAATHAVTGAFLWMENPTERAAVVEFALSGGVIMITGKAGGRGSALMSACDLLEDGVTWHQDSADVITVVAVTWLEQGIDDEGKPVTTERTETVTDTAALAEWGTRRLSVGTELITAADAQAMAARLLAQARLVTWRLDGLAFDTRALMETVESVTDATRADALLDMLDGTSRMGLALTLADMPAYAPGGEVQSVYLEGGTYSYSDGDWVLQLAATPSAGQGKSAQWGQLDPTWQWSEWDTSITWSDTFGVAP